MTRVRPWLAAELPDAFAVRADLDDAEQIDVLIKELKEEAGRGSYVNGTVIHVNGGMFGG